MLISKSTPESAFNQHADQQGINKNQKLKKD
jgi:hypothetical protein